MTEPLEVSNKVWTIPNLISMSRLLLVPVVGILIFREHYVAAVVVLALSGFTDWLDGVIARHFNQMTKLGQALDPMADRLFIFITLIGLCAKGFIPWWILVVIVARDLAVGVTIPLLTKRGVPGYPVHFAGKAGTFALMYAFPLLLLGQLDGVIGTICWVVGWAAALWGVYLYWCSAAIYLDQFREFILAERSRAKPSTSGAS